MVWYLMNPGDYEQLVCENFSAPISVDHFRETFDIEYFECWNNVGGQKKRSICSWLDTLPILKSLMQYTVFGFYSGHRSLGQKIASRLNIRPTM
ncbi:hypothetical protein K7X08_014726 [Anisodus acutangulus]|uniref:Uncharacterized protein n=1 Tax=Anisodus acutangulus TaxID=402998 RepID=A0A9Q1LIS9_9SOLA|nr:hypothetical protein K7X08_014726 [Anisodus acutangulus]